jgi:DNA-binding MurR/RpiR family transcriptional regulator
MFIPKGFAMSDSAVAPKDFPGLKSLIMEKAADLPKRLTQVASFALDHPDEIAFGTAASVAMQADVQPSTLVRFSQALGYQGFSELQEVFRSRLRDRVLSYDERIAQLREHAASASKANVLFQGFAEASEKSLADLRMRMDQRTLDGAVELLARAGTIYVIGRRRSFPVAAYVSYAFSKLGVRHILLDGLAGLDPESMSLATAKDAVLAISFTPYAIDTINLVTQAGERGVPIVAMTDGAFSPLAQRARIWFEIVEANFEGFRSFAATFALTMALTVAIAEKR